MSFSSFRVFVIYSTSKKVLLQMPSDITLLKLVQERPKTKDLDRIEKLVLQLSCPKFEWAWFPIRVDFSNKTPSIQARIYLKNRSSVYLDMLSFRYTSVHSMRRTIHMCPVLLQSLFRISFHDSSSATLKPGKQRDSNLLTSQDILSADFPRDSKVFFLLKMSFCGHGVHCELPGAAVQGGRSGYQLIQIRFARYSTYPLGHRIILSVSCLNPST